jgi:hypothetical protein
MARPRVAIATHGDHGQHPVFRHQRQRAGKPEPDAGAPAALFERIEIGQHHQRQRHQLQQVRIVFEPLEVEDRVEREHHHHKERAAPVDHAQRGKPGDHQAAAHRRHRQRVSRPVGDRKDLKPEARDPSRQGWVLAIAELEFLAPGEGLGDIEMNILRRLELDQDERPHHRVQKRKTDDQPKAGLRRPSAGHKPRRHPPQSQPAPLSRQSG